MRRVLFVLALAVVSTARFASAAAISVAGADCGTNPLLGLTFSTATGTNLPLIVNGSGVACPEGNVGLGAIIGEPGDGGGAPLYGFDITAIDLAISDAGQLDGLEILSGSAFTDFKLTTDGLQLFGGEGIHIGCTILADVELPRGAICSPRDALITFAGFEPGTTFSVTAVNGVSAVPEPASLALLASGLSAAALRRRRR